LRQRKAETITRKILLTIYLRILKSQSRPPRTPPVLGISEQCAMTEYCLIVGKKRQHEPMAAVVGLTNRIVPSVIKRPDKGTWIAKRFT
jgi:hypothetical protein